MTGRRVLGQDHRPPLRVIVDAVRLVARADPRGFAVAAGLQAAGAGAAVGMVTAGQWALQGVVAGGRQSDLVPALVVLAAASAVSSGVVSIQVHQQRLLGEDVGTATWTRLLEVTGRVDLAEAESPAFADRLERLSMNALDRPAQLATATLGLVGSMLGVAALTVAVLRLQPLLVPLLLGAGLPATLLARYASRTEFAFSRRWSELARTRLYMRRILADRHFAADVRAFQTENEVIDRHRELSGRYRRVLRSQVRRRQGLVLTSTGISAAALAVALAVIAGLVGSGRLSLAQAGAAVIAVRLLSGQLDQVFATVGGIVEAGPFLAELDAFVRTSVVHPSSEQPPWPLRDGLSLRDVRYRYPGGARTVLHGVDLDVRPGEVVALVGENGSGKTTLSKIAAGLYAPTAGTMHWDGAVLGDADRPGLRRSAGVIFQDFVRYDLSVADNIDLARRRCGRDLADARIAAAQARISETVERLPGGFDTMLGRAFEGGQDLSGGQWQRIALARALIRRTPLLVLDEPSSGLDPRAEHDLMNDVRAGLGGRAVLFISHRYANLHLADRIYVLAEGRVVESGSHAELIAADGLYRQLYQLQSQAYQPA